MQGISWLQFVVFAIISGALMFLTGSFLISLGILNLLFVLEYFIERWIEKRKRNK